MSKTKKLGWLIALSVALISAIVGFVTLNMPSKMAIASGETVTVDGVVYTLDAYKTYGVEDLTGSKTPANRGNQYDDFIITADADESMTFTWATTAKVNGTDSYQTISIRGTDGLYQGVKFDFKQDANGLGQIQYLGLANNPKFDPSALDGGLHIVEVGAIDCYKADDATKYVYVYVKIDNDFKAQVITKYSSLTYPAKGSSCGFMYYFTSLSHYIAHGSYYTFADAFDQCSVPAGNNYYTAKTPKVPEGDTALVLSLKVNGALNGILLDFSTTISESTNYSPNFRVEFGKADNANGCYVQFLDKANGPTIATLANIWDTSVIGEGSTVITVGLFVRSGTIRATLVVEGPSGKKVQEAYDTKLSATEVFRQLQVRSSGTMSIVSTAFGDVEHASPVYTDINVGTCAGCGATLSDMVYNEYTVTDLTGNATYVTGDSITKNSGVNEKGMRFTADFSMGSTCVTAHNNRFIVLRYGGGGYAGGVRFSFVDTGLKVYAVNNGVTEIGAYAKTWETNKFYALDFYAVDVPSSNKILVVAKIDGISVVNVTVDKEKVQLGNEYGIITGSKDAMTGTVDRLKDAGATLNYKAVLDVDGKTVNDNFDYGGSYTFTEKEVSGKVVLGWIYDGGFVENGTVINNLKANFTAKAVVLELATLNKASMKVNGTPGLRFQAVVLGADVEEVEQEIGAELSFGMRITSEDKPGYLDIPVVYYLNQSWTDSNGEYSSVLATDDGTFKQYTAVLTGFDDNEDCYSYNFTATAYVKFSVGEEEVVVFAKTTATRSIVQCAQLLLEDYKAVSEGNYTVEFDGKFYKDSYDVATLTYIKNVADKIA